MKLFKYQLIATSKLEPYEIKAHILLKLKDKGYRVQEINDTSIEFDDDPWVMRWRHEQLNRLENGVFEFKTLGNQTIITFTHFSKPTAIIIPLIFIILVTIISQSYTPIAFFGIVFTVVFFFSQLVQKSVGQELLNSIIGENHPASQ